MAEKSKLPPLADLTERQREAIKVLAEQGLLPELVEGLSDSSSAKPPPSSTSGTGSASGRSQALKELQEMLPDFSEQEIDDLSQEI